MELPFDMGMLMPKRAAVIHKHEEILENEVVDRHKQIVTTEKGKYVVEESWVRTLKHFVVVREFDPDASYADAISEFVEGNDASTE